jgi:hypothetical protein
METCPEGLVYGGKLTSEWRSKNLGKAAGGGETSRAEHYQRKAVEVGTGLKCPKSDGIRINFRKNKLEQRFRPLAGDDGFDYTEDFDGMQNAPFGLVFISFKCVCKTSEGGGGGNQTRTLRECYHFAEYQLKFLLKRNKKAFFANILDGDESDARMKHFKYLCTLPEYSHVAHMVYVGNLGGYFDWFNKCATKE